MMGTVAFCYLQMSCLFCKTSKDILWVCSCISARESLMVSHAIQMAQIRILMLVSLCAEVPFRITQCNISIFYFTK